MRGKTEKTRVKPSQTVASEPPPSQLNWPVFDSIAHCAGVTGIPKDRLQDWKRAGAPGFRGSRIYFGDLLPWLAEKIFSPGEDGGMPPVVTWDDILAKQKFEERAGVLVEFAKASAIIRDSMLPLRQFLLSMAPTLAPLTNPSDPLHAFKAIELHVKQGMRMIAEAERQKLNAK